MKNDLFALNKVAFIHEATSDAYLVTRAITGDEIIDKAKEIIGQQSEEGIFLVDLKSAKNFFLFQLFGLSYEVFSVAFLDVHLKLISYEQLFRGSIHEAVVYPREVAKRALDLNAANLIFAHNHPSGNNTPSMADRKITMLLSKAVALFDIMVIDHFVVGNNQVYSFAENGLLDVS